MRLICCVFVDGVLLSKENSI